MTHYKFQIYVSSGDWVDSVFLNPGTFDSASQYLEHIIKVPYFTTNLSRFTYRFMFFSEALGKWYALSIGTLNEIFQSYNIHPFSNIVDIET